MLKWIETKIIQVRKYNEYQPSWNGTGIVFYVKNGMSLLTYTPVRSKQDETYYTLMYNDEPMISLHDNFESFNTYDPTGEQIIFSGYNLDWHNKDWYNEIKSQVNHAFVSIEDSLQKLQPLLKILESGYYALVEAELSPTNGDGEFFWQFNNKNIFNSATGSHYFGHGRYSNSMPFFLSPTISPTYYDREKAEYYKTNPEYPAIAFYLSGSMCALIEGHHKVAAAALRGEMVKTLIIVPGFIIQYGNFLNNAIININDVTLHKKELKAEKKYFGEDVRHTVDSSLLERYLKDLASISCNYEWPKEIREASKRYPTAEAVSRISLVDDLSDQKITNILNNTSINDDEDFEDVLNICYALFYNKDPRFKKLAFYLGLNLDYVTIWHPVYKLLAMIENDEEIDDFFVQFLIACDPYYIDRKHIKLIIDEYFRKQNNCI